MFRGALIRWIGKAFPAPQVHAHCDAPCGVYDPASARIAAEAVLALTGKILDLKAPKDQNTITRYIQIKEEQAQIAKEELLILWTDYFKPEHLKKYPGLHGMFWKAAKLCSAVKVEVSLKKAEGLLEAVKEVHRIFWQTKDTKAGKGPVTRGMARCIAAGNARKTRNAPAWARAEKRNG